MAIASTAVWNVSASATSGNVNGAGFNTANPNMLTNLSVTSGTTASPVVSSASYNFVSTDVGAWLYIQTGSNWIAGWYQIFSVASNKATLTAGVGTAILGNLSNFIPSYNTSAGCVNGSYVSGTASGTFTIDYSQQNTAQINGTALTCPGNSSTITCSGVTFTPVMVGNHIQITAAVGGTPVLSWFEIVTYTSAHVVILDRTPTDGTNSLTSATFYVGGSGRYGTNDVNFSAIFAGGNSVWVQNGSYTFSGAPANASLVGGIIGYNTIRGDNPTGSNRPTFSMGSNVFGYDVPFLLKNIIFIGSGVYIVGSASSGVMLRNCKILNTSTTANRPCLQPTQYCSLIDCEVTSQNGYGTANQNNISAIGCYFHDSVYGLYGGFICIASCIFESNLTYGINNTLTNNPNLRAFGNTFYGAEVQRGGGLNNTVINSNSISLVNNIFYGFTTAISGNTSYSPVNTALSNNFYNNGTNTSNWSLDPSDTFVNPTFTNISQVTGTVGQGLAGSKFQDSTKNFTTLGVVANQDFLHITSGGSLTAGCYLITAISTTTNPNDTLTLNNSPGTGTAAAVYWITINHNLTPNSTFVGHGSPTFTDTNPSTVSYPTQGAIIPKAGGGTIGGVYCQ